MVVVLLSLVGAGAHAQGFDGQRHTPPAGSSGGLAVERADITAAGSVGLYASLATSPVIFRRNGVITERPLRSAMVLDLMGSIALVDRLELGLAVPVAPIYAGDRLVQPEYTFEAAPGLGDLRLAPKLAILGKTGTDGLRLGVSVPVR
ncbi:MAG: hypothetical protein AAF211_31530, partial [Myxococcota bacterium]